jgi:hypothetical protein
VRPHVDRKAVERQVRDRLAGWRALLMSGAVEDGRQLFREILVGPIRFTPEKGEKLTYRFEGEIAFDRLFSGIAGLAPFMASPTGSGGCAVQVGAGHDGHRHRAVTSRGKLRSDRGRTARRKRPVAFEAR